MKLRSLLIHASLLPCNKRSSLAKAVIEGKPLPAWAEMETVDTEAVSRIEESCHRLGATIVCANDDSYPDSLRKSPMPPAAFFVLGDAKLLLSDKMLAIVGSRNADISNSEVAADFAKAAALSGMPVISGLALGIDGAAHIGALSTARSGATLAVVANGLDIVYPSSHSQLSRRILSQGGAVVSEYPPGASPRTYQFLERNRIVACLSFGVVVIQAGEKSGALVTARLAIEAGRDVWVVPGSIRDPRFRGSNRLIQDGAHLISTPFEIPGISPVVEDLSGTMKGLSESESRIVEAVRTRGAVSVEELLTSTGLSYSGLRLRLGKLELSGVIEMLPGNFVRLSTGDGGRPD